MIRTVTTRILLGLSGFGLVAGATVLTAAPTINTALAAARTAPGSPNGSKEAGHMSAGTIVKLSDNEMTVRTTHRTAKGATPTSNDTTFELNGSTAVYFWGSKDKHGIDALKLGQDVGVRFVEQDAQKVARRVAIRPDHRAGRIVSKNADGKSFTIQTREGKTVHVTTSDRTRFIEGPPKNHKTGSYADLKVGDRVFVLGQEDSQHIFDAAVVHSANPDLKVKPGTTSTP